MIEILYISDNFDEIYNIIANFERKYKNNERLQKSNVSNTIVNIKAEKDRYYTIIKSNILKSKCSYLRGKRIKNCVVDLSIPIEKIDSKTFQQYIFPIIEEEIELIDTEYINKNYETVHELIDRLSKVEKIFGNTKINYDYLPICDMDIDVIDKILRLF